MAGASICLTQAKPPVLTTSMLSQEQEKVAESRVKNMKIFQGMNSVAIEQVSTQCPWPLGNCSEYPPWEALLNGHHVNLYSHTFTLEKMEVKNLCLKCRISNLDDPHGSRNCSPMVIEVIANEYERNHFASYVDRGHCKVTNLNCIKKRLDLEIYVDVVQEFVFNHIILIGECEHGMIFLDCYGRVFMLDMMTGVLWPLGDTLEEARMRPWTFDVSWIVDEKTGTVYDVERYRGTVDRDQEDQKPPENRENP